MILQTRRKLKTFLSWFTALRFAVLHYASEINSPPALESEEDSPSDLAKTILTTLNQALAQGHTCLPLIELFRALKRDNATPEDVAISLEQLSEVEQIHLTDKAVSLPLCAEVESFIHIRVVALSRIKRLA